MGSLRERSTSQLLDAIRSPTDQGKVLLRLATCFAMPYFAPEQDEAMKSAVTQSFLQALDGLPTWAILRAFDAWEKTFARRPTPAEIRNLAGNEIKALTDELALRQKTTMLEPSKDTRVDRATAAKILQDSGFTLKRMEAVRSAPMARTMDEAEAARDQVRTPHWSETAAPDDPRWEALRRSRAASTVVPMYSPKPAH
jgi:hypothetical protein